MTALLAGFECGRLGWNGHDLLATTRHLPGDRMRAHYRVAMGHGLQRARDGLPWRHHPGLRLEIARAVGIDVIWDLNHFDPPDNAVAHARRVANSAASNTTLWICPVNEPSLYPALCGMSREKAVAMAVSMVRVAKDRHPDVRVLTTDPITGIGERQFAATDALVASGLIDVVGVNYYPHTARTSLLKVLTKVWRRYRLPILVSETSWHDGHPDHHRRHPHWTKGDWLRHILQDVSDAEDKGVKIVGVCWYPIVDCPPWQRPRSRQRWSHGLIRHDLSVDPHLSAALLDHRPTHPTQLTLDLRRAG